MKAFAISFLRLFLHLLRKTGLKQRMSAWERKGSFLSIHFINRQKHTLLKFSYVGRHGDTGNEHSSLKKIITLLELKIISTIIPINSSLYMNNLFNLSFCGMWHFFLVMVTTSKEKRTHPDRKPHAASLFRRYEHAVFWPGHLFKQAVEKLCLNSSKIMFNFSTKGNLREQQTRMSFRTLYCYVLIERANIICGPKYLTSTVGRLLLLLSYLVFPFILRVMKLQEFS